VSAPRPICLRLDDDLLRASRASLVVGVVDRVRATSACLVVADVAALTADGEALDALARLQLAVRRAGAVLVLRRPSGRLRALLDLTGLAEALPVDDVAARDDPGSSVEVVGQAELGEVPRSDEVRDAGDPAVAHLEHVDRPRLTASGDRARLVLGEGT
jgi:anti-anti-sigma regulatory factor